MVIIKLFQVCFCSMDFGGFQLLGVFDFFFHFFGMSHGCLTLD